MTLRPEAGLDGDLYFLPDPPDEPPSWLAPLATIATSVPALRTRTPGAILLLQAAGAAFAVTFGRGHARLRRECLVQDFGVKITANLVDPDRVVGADSRAVEQSVFLTRRQASRGTDIGALGFEDARESLQALTGLPRDPAFARRVTGRVGFLLTRQVAPTQLPAVAAELLDAYRATAYKDAFGILDRSRRLDDDTRIAELDALVVAGLGKPDLGGAYLAPPEVVDWLNVAGFRFSGDPRGTRRQEPTLRDYRQMRGVITLEGLRGDRLSLITRDANRSIAWSVYDCLVAERHEDDGAFVLADGTWWEVDRDFVAKIDTIVASIEEADVPLVAFASTDESEGAYNRRAAEALSGATALDADLARVRGERGRIELCDIAGPGRRLIHVKRGLRAQSLSHLFAQAVMSAEALRHLPEVRAHLRNVLEKPLPAIAGQIVPEEGMRSADWEVVIAIISPTPDRVPRDLPFFSRAHLARTVTALRRLDYRVAYRGIDVDRDGA